MAGPIGVDLETAQQCGAIDMIEFLFAYCSSDKNERVLTRKTEVLEKVFKKVKKIAKRGDRVLATGLSEL
jgi:hypothetical protein